MQRHGHPPLEKLRVIGLTCPSNQSDQDLTSELRIVLDTSPHLLLLVHLLFGKEAAAAMAEPRGRGQAQWLARRGMRWSQQRA